MLRRGRSMIAYIYAIVAQPLNRASCAITNSFLARERLAGRGAQGDDDGDEVLPRRLAETKRLAGQRIVALHFGGQHAALLTVPGEGGQEAAPAEKPTPDAASEPAAVDEAEVSDLLRFRTHGIARVASLFALALCTVCSTLSSVQKPFLHLTPCRLGI